MRTLIVLVGLLPAVASADAGLDEYRARREILAQCEGHGELPPVTPTIPMRDALVDVSRRIRECNSPSTTTRAETPVQPVVQAPPPPAPITGARPPEQEMEAAEPIPEFPQELLDEIRRTLHRAIDGAPSDASVTALARSLHSMEEGERDAILDCIEEEGGSIRSERESDRRLRSLRRAVRNCISPPEPEATPEQLADVAEGVRSGFGSGGSPFGPDYSANLDHVGFIDSYPYRWEHAGRRRVSIRNTSNRCFLEVQLSGSPVKMVQNGMVVVAPVENRPGTFVSVIPPGHLGNYILQDDNQHPERIVCHQGNINEVAPPNTIINWNGQPALLVSSSPVAPVASRENDWIRSGSYRGPRPINELSMRQLASRE